MTGIKGPVTIVKNGANEALVNLGRLAAKVSLNTKVVKMVDKYSETNSGTNRYEGTYFPNIDHIRIYLNYVNSKAPISGDCQTYLDATYFSYTRDAYIPTITDVSFDPYDKTPGDTSDDVMYPGYGVTGTPFYTYPTAWDSRDTKAPFIKVIIPWVSYNVPEAIRRKYTTFNTTDHCDRYRRRYL